MRILIETEKDESDGKEASMDLNLHRDRITVTGTSIHGDQLTATLEPGDPVMMSRITATIIEAVIRIVAIGQAIALGDAHHSAVTRREEDN